MKNQIFLVLGLFLAITCHYATAQTGGEYLANHDTILINLSPDAKIVLMGNDMQGIAKYMRLDTLKTLLIEDIRKAKLSPNYPAESHNTHYFIARSGKRRLKAESDDYQGEINVGKEKFEMRLNLPAYMYTIHDMTTGYETYIYVTAP